MQALLLTLIFTVLVSCASVAPTRADDTPAKCAELAASPLDQSRPKGVRGIDFDKLDFESAIPACELALLEFPHDGQIEFQLARVLHKAKQDLPRMVSLYQDAAEQGSVAAMSNLGSLYATGVGVSKDFIVARAWYEKAAGGGDPFAMLALGRIYEFGKGVRKNLIEANEWYLKAASLDQIDAMLALARIVPVVRSCMQAWDIDRPKYWLEKAAALGNERARIALLELATAAGNFEAADRLLQLLEKR